MSNGSLSEYLREHPDADKLRWYVGILGPVAILLDNPYRPLVPVIGCRSRASLPTSVWPGSWELNHREFWFSRPEMRTYNPLAQHSGGW